MSENHNAERKYFHVPSVWGGNGDADVFQETRILPNDGGELVEAFRVEVKPSGNPFTDKKIATALERLRQSWEKGGSIPEILEPYVQ